MISIVCRATARASSQCPLVNAGCPQHVCLGLNWMSQPRRRSSRTVATPTDGRIWSTRHVTNSDTRGARFDGRLTWHDACHGLRDLGIHEQPRKLIRKIAGAEFVETDQCDACCGFGGVFAINYPDISTSMADVKLDVIDSVGVDVVVSGDVGCLMQLETRAQHRKLPVRTMHLAELLSPA